MRRLLTLTLALCGALSAQSLTSTTTTGAVTPDSPSLQLASTTGAAVGYELYMDREAMIITAVGSGAVTVKRGQEGTAATSHLSGSTVYVGPSRFFSPNDLNGSGCTSKAAVGETLLSVRSGSRWTCQASGVWLAVGLATVPFTDDGTTVTFGTGRSVAIGGTALDPFARRSIDIRNLDLTKAVAPNATGALATPVPYTGTELVHPDVVFAPSGWNGHRFWMVVEPYAGSDNTTENPSIYYSDDGQTWATPAGLTNPVIPASPPNGGYNSDADITIGPDGVMYMVYIVESSNSGATNEVRVSKTSDGVNWAPTPGQVVLTTTNTTERIVSPSLVYDGVTWTMYYIDNHSVITTPGTPPYAIYKRTASSVYGPWSSAVTVTGISPPSGQQLWHLDAQRVNGRTVLLIITNDTGGNGHGQLYLAWSDDGTAFTRATNPVLSYSNANGWDESLYRSTFALLTDGYETKLAIWYGISVGTGGTTKWQLGYTEATLRPYAVSNFLDLMNPHEYDMLRACLGITGVACDSFNRADSNTALGSPTYGPSWSNDTGVWGTLSKKAYLPSATNSKAILDSGISDFRLEARLDTPGGAGTSEYITFRWSDTNNYWRFGNANITNKSLRLEKVVAGSVTAVLTFGVAAVAGDWLKVVTSGNTVSVYRNGALLGTTTDSFNSTATKVGLQTANTTTRFSGFVVMAP